MEVDIFFNSLKFYSGHSFPSSKFYFFFFYNFSDTQLLLSAVYNALRSKNCLEAALRMCGSFSLLSVCLRGFLPARVLLSFTSAVTHRARHRLYVILGHFVKLQSFTQTTGTNWRTINGFLRFRGWKLAHVSSLAKLTDSLTKLHFVLQKVITEVSWKLSWI